MYNMIIVVERLVMCVFFFFKQKTAYEMRISDWSSDVCSSDLCFGQRPLWPLQVFGCQENPLEQFLGRVVAACGANDWQSCVDSKVTSWGYLTWLLTVEALITARKRRAGAATALSIIKKFPRPLLKANRPEERRVGKRCVRTCRSR